MKKIRVLQMPVRNAKGGITQYALRNWEHIDKSRFIFDWATLDKELSFERELERQGCRVYRLSCRQEDDEAKFRTEMEAILADGCDVIHLHTSYWRGFLAEELAIAAGVPKIIVHAHNTGVSGADPAERARLSGAHSQWKERFHTGLATHFAACSENAAEFLFGPHIPREKIRILRNAVDVDKFAYDEEARKETRKRLGVENSFVLLQTGRLEYQKNFGFTLEVFEEYSHHNPNAVLLIAGDGSLRGELQKRAEPLGGKVRFLGFRSDVCDLLRAADVFLQPSLFEGFSIASMEAQCSGIMWLVSDAVPIFALPLAGNEAHVVDRVLPLDKAAWVAMLKKAEMNPCRDVFAAKRLRKLGWDLRDSVKTLEGLYGEESAP